MRSLLVGWGLNIKTPVQYTDNTAALAAMNKGATWRSRHFAVISMRLGEEVQAKRVTMQWTSTHSMIADGFTKVLTGGESLKRFTESVGLTCGKGTLPKPRK
eukprot:6491364-Amphidinium_carterae.1